MVQQSSQADTKAHRFSGFTAQSKITRNPRKNRTAAAKAGHFHSLCGTGKPVPWSFYISRGVDFWLLFILGRS
jgi:hypothetical protein